MKTRISSDVIAGLSILILIVILLTITLSTHAMDGFAHPIILRIFLFGVALFFAFVLVMGCLPNSGKRNFGIKNQD